LSLDDQSVADREEFSVAVPFAGLPQLVLVHDEHVVACGGYPLQLLGSEAITGREAPLEEGRPVDAVVLGTGEDEILGDEAFGGGAVAFDVGGEVAADYIFRWPRSSDDELQRSPPPR